MVDGGNVKIIKSGKYLGGGTQSYTIKIVREDSYRDGGTKAYFTNSSKEYCIDNRFEQDPNNPGFSRKVSTAGKWFEGYPNEGNCNIITDENLINELNLAKINYEKSEANKYMEQI